MTAPNSRKRSLADEFEEDHPLDAAAARAAVSAVSLINTTFDNGPRESQLELAKALGITEGRVSQVLNGDGNIRVSTLARFLKANGFDLLLQAEHPHASSRPSSPGWDRTSTHFVSHDTEIYADKYGIDNRDVLTFSHTPRPAGTLVSKKPNWLKTPDGRMETTYATTREDGVRPTRDHVGTS